MFGLVTKKGLEKRIEKLVKQLSFFVDLSVDCHVLEQHSVKNCFEAANEPVVEPEEEPEAPTSATHIVTVTNLIRTYEVTAVWYEFDKATRTLIFEDENKDLVAIFTDVQSCVKKDSE